MATLKITGPGLSAIALSVGLLWGCFVCEKLTVRRAQRDNARIVLEMRELQRRQNATPVSLPAPRSPRTARPAAG
jgi:hypothetical protein